MKAIALGLALAAVFSFSASAGTVSRFTTPEGKDVITFSGEIVPGDANHMIEAVQSSNKDGRIVIAVRFNSLGGNLEEGIKIADEIRFAKIDTVVINGARCASACFIAFAAGLEKYASYSAGIGVHGASFNGQETEGSRAATIEMAKVVKELGVPPSIIGKMVVTPPEQVVWLQPEDLRSMGVILTGSPNNGPRVNAQIPTGGPPGAGLAASANLPPVGSGGNDLNSMWKQLVDGAMQSSSAQHNGKPDYGRSCQPELKICNMAVFYIDNQGRSTMVRLAEDMNGIAIKRDICTFNSYGDIRTCLNWDTSVSTQEMKNNKGEWYEIN